MHASTLPGSARLSISPLAERAIARLISLPLPRLEIRSYAHLIASSPASWIKPDRMSQDLADRHVVERCRTFDLLVAPVVVAGVAMIDAAGLVFKPAFDRLVPGVGLVPRVLLGLGMALEFGSSGHHWLPPGTPRRFRRRGGHGRG